MAKARWLWLPPFEKGGIEGGFLQQILPRPLLLQRRGERQRRGGCDFPPLKKGGLRGDSYSKSSPGPSFCKGGGNSEHP